MEEKRVEGFNTNLILTALVRDEIDVIAAMLDFHLAHGVDRIIVTDNGSVDGTLDVLHAYARRGVVELLREPPADFSQHRWVTRMARLAYDEFHADWVIHADADELFVPLRHASLKEVLVDAGPEITVLSPPRHDFVPFHRPNRDAPQAEMVFRKQVSLNLAGSRLPPKVIHRGVADVVVSQGNRAVTGPRLGTPVPCSDIAVYHYPIRSYTQFKSKVANGGGGYAANRELPSEVGFHKRYWYGLLQEGRLEDAYHADYLFDAEQLRTGLADGTLMRDTLAASFFVRRRSLTEV